MLFFILPWNIIYHENRNTNAFLPVASFEVDKNCYASDQWTVLVHTWLYELETILQDIWLFSLVSRGAYSGGAKGAMTPPLAKVAPSNHL